ncbi:hypothetical protein [Streptomyces thermolilacinus]|uniref:Uncharacterized protein n=1 Tax=Streptomyces thermolilacinus SPC6 TaxID=1306406 RepID=A0A1D3DUS8_9ACTN|nr:hypothetical protein [Streptomyces thermolilacinus]OEJ96075.1 hypothetical protein J116_017970 [Streptomyces thermolilacinus SPC6]
MPRPTVARLALGSATVICSTVTLLLLTGTTSDAGIAVSAVLSLLLGLAVTLARTAEEGGESRAAGREPAAARERRSSVRG